MKTWRLQRGGGVESLELTETERPAPAPHEVRLRVRAVSLNHRDLLVARETGGTGHVVPGSDAAGDVIETGDAVTEWKLGDRVFVAFFPAWLDGEPTPANSASGFGGGIDGLLAEEVVVPSSALVRLPANLDFSQGATLPCAGVTAWNALFAEGRVRPGDSVLLLGTGGVSIWALQLAKAAGLRVLITSSDDAKLERARALGADATINYANTPRWDEAVHELTQGRGVDLVLETGGDATLARSLRAARKGGTVAVIGGTSGGYGGTLEPWALVGGAKRLAGILVGNRRMAEDLARFVGQAHIEPVVDRRFRFADARAAFDHLAAARHFGKVVIEA